MLSQPRPTCKVPKCARTTQGGGWSGRGAEHWCGDGLPFQRAKRQSTGLIPSPSGRPEAGGPFICLPCLLSFVCLCVCIHIELHLTGHRQEYISTRTNVSLHVTFDLWGALGVAVCLPYPIQGPDVQRHAHNPPPPMPDTVKRQVSGRHNRRGFTLPLRDRPGVAGSKQRAPFLRWNRAGGW